MTPDLFLSLGVVPALRLLPPVMDSPGARALLLAIALQESGLRTRHQIQGPAKSYLMFEGAGVLGVLFHKASKAHAQALCQALDIVPTTRDVFAAFAFQDVLAAGFARLLLWTLPNAIPARDEPGYGWTMYVDGWRPGTPRPETWPAYYAAAWDRVAGVLPREG